MRHGQKVAVDFELADIPTDALDPTYDGVDIPVFVYGTFVKGCKGDFYTPPEADWFEDVVVLVAEPGCASTDITKWLNPAALEECIEYLAYSVERGQYYTVG